MNRPPYDNLNQQEKWDFRFLDMCEHVSNWSKDPSTKVGAVITDGVKIVSVGYNGLPKQVPSVDEQEILINREEKYKYIIHAEINAILTANGNNLKGCTLYTFPFLTCTNCASIAVQSGITRIVSYDCSEDRWFKNIQEAKSLLSRSNVSFKEYPITTKETR